MCIRDRLIVEWLIIRPRTAAQHGCLQECQLVAPRMANAFSLVIEVIANKHVSRFHDQDGGNANFVEDRRKQDRTIYTVGFAPARALIGEADTLALDAVR